MEIGQKDAQCVANATVGIRETREDFLREGNIVGEVHAAHPQAEQIRAVFVDVMVGVGRLLVSTGGGLGDFLAGVHIHHETVSENRAVGGAAIQGHGCHERTLEPTAVLIRCLEIEVGGEAEFRTLA